MTQNELLVPVSVPWMISPSVPYLRLHPQKDGGPLTATFIGYFKCEGTPVQRSGVAVVSDPGSFARADSATGSEYRLLQVEFDGAVKARERPSFSDSQVIPEASYDRSLVPGGVLPGEGVKEAIARRHHQWLSTGLSPDPGMYEVQRSVWLRSLGLAELDWHHYLLLGHDEYVEVVARGWSWSPGQPLSS